MFRRYLLAACAAALFFATAARADVYLPCDPCTVDPCELAPERCNPPGGGPIE